MMRRTTTAANDGLGLGTIIWDEVASPVGVVQIAHGLSEHCARYAGLAGRLTAAGYVVCAHDHRGHGHTADGHQLGHFANDNGWDLVVEDISTVGELVMSEYPGLPRFLIGHSMGSVLARSNAIGHCDDLAGLVLSGPAGDPGFAGRAGRLLARAEARIRGASAPSSMLEKLSFGRFNADFKPNRTAFDWLSRDDEQVDRYISDPLCGATPSAQLFADMLGGLIQACSDEGLGRIRKELPVLILAGGLDPVGERGRGAAQIRDQLVRLGLGDVSMKLYPGARHEIFNETNSDEIISDLVTWLDAHR